jgi:lysozyme
MIKELIKRHEGYSSYPYKCPAGKNTIGWGHNLDAGILPRDIEIYLGNHGLITPDMAERLLDIDIKLADAACHRLFPKFDSFSEARKAAILDFVFNVGEGTAKKFKKARTEINAGEWDKAAKEMQDSLWFVQVKGRAVTICKMIREG